MPSISDNDQGSQVWPSLPAVPRYAFIGHIYGESNRVDAPERNGLARMLAAIVGLDVAGTGTEVGTRKRTTNLISKSGNSDEHVEAGGLDETRT